MMIKMLMSSFVLLSMSIPQLSGFVVPSQRPQFHKVGMVTTDLSAKKKKGKSAGQGFGKKSKKVESKTRNVDRSFGEVVDSQEKGEAQVLQSVESGGSAAIPSIDESVPADERAKNLLRDQYGLKPIGERKMLDNIKEQRKKLDDWESNGQEDADFDFLALVPGPLLAGIDGFLKFGVGLSVLLFVLAGVFITIEAFSATSGTTLPPSLDAFIVNIVEPNFTIGLGVVLAFSVSLGAFAAAQLSSGTSTYREDN